MHSHWQLAFNNGSTAEPAHKLLLEYVHEHDSEFILFHILKYGIQRYAQCSMDRRNIYETVSNFAKH